MEILQAVGGIAGIIAFLGFLWAIAVYLAQIKVRTDTLWEFWLEDIKRNHEGQGYLAGQLTERGHAALPEEVKRDIFRARKKGPAATLKCVGLARASQVAASEGISLEHVVAIIKAYLDEVNER